MSIYTGSRYTSTPTYYPRGSDKQVFDIRERKKLDLTDNIKFHTWTSTDRLDYLAYTLYGDSKYWWALLDANPQYQSEFDIKVGDLLAIPTYEEVINSL